MALRLPFLYPEVQAPVHPPPTQLPAAPSSSMSTPGHSTSPAPAAPSSATPAPAAPPRPTVLDRLSRPLRDLRVSVTDRCNYRCTYCMPNATYQWIERAQILRFEEIERLVRLFVEAGVDSVRLTGGEPLVRRDLERLVARLARIPALNDISLTTNGSLLAQKAQPLRDAGLSRLNVSLDTLRPDRFAQITQRNDHAAVMAGIDAARAAGFAPLKINAVIVRGVNDNELLDLAAFGREQGHEMRFIEYMDVGNANGWSLDRTVPKREMLERIAARWPVRELGRADNHAPAVDYAYQDGLGRVGLIGSVTEPFCGSCTRARLTADGKLVTCLFSDVGHDLKGLLRGGASDEELASHIHVLWTARTDRFSDERWEAIQAGRPYRAGDHHKIEMITLGG